MERPQSNRHGRKGSGANDDVCLRSPAPRRDPDRLFFFSTNNQIDMLATEGAEHRHREHKANPSAIILVVPFLCELCVRAPAWLCDPSPKLSSPTSPASPPRSAEPTQKNPTTTSSFPAKQHSGTYLLLLAVSLRASVRSVLPNHANDAGIGDVTVFCDGRNAKDDGRLTCPPALNSRSTS